MTDILNNWQPEVKAQEAAEVLNFITHYVEIHRKPQRSVNAATARS